VPNDAPGVARAVSALADLAPELVVLEATGTYHRPLLAALLAAGVPTAVANPAQVAAFRQTGLGREKSDRADARLLARFAQVHGAELRRAVAAEPVQARLRDLVAYRDGQVAERTRLKNRLHANAFGGDAWVADRLAADLAEVEARLGAVEAEVARLLAELPEAAVLVAMPGVGPRVAAAVLAYLPVGVWGDAKAAAAYAGVHPRRDQSGQRDRSRLSKQGHAGLRRSLYVAATVAVRCDGELTAFRDRLRRRGHAPPSATCAVMHKLLRRMMGRRRAFDAARAAATTALAA
jgi:transposase